MDTIQLHRAHRMHSLFTQTRPSQCHDTNEQPQVHGSSDHVTLSPEAHDALHADANQNNSPSALSGVAATRDLASNARSVHEFWGLSNLFKAAPAAEEVAADAPHGTPAAAADAANVADAAEGAGPLGKGLGVLGLAAGLGQGVHAANEFGNHQYFKGSMDAVQSATNTGAAGAETATAFNLVKGAGAVEMAGKLSVGLTAVTAGVDGAASIVDGVQHDNYAEVGRGGLKEASAGLMVGGLATADPILVGAGVALYGGTLVYENRKAIEHLGGEAINGIGSAASTVGNVAEHVGGDVVHGIGDAASSVGNTAEHVASDLNPMNW